MQQSKESGYAPHGYNVPQAPPAEGPWSAGFWDCFSDLKTCCTACWCPCVTFGRIAEIVDHGSVSCGASGALYTLIMFFVGCRCLYSCFYRSKMRKQYNLKGNDCGDCLRHCFCETCALTQEYRELKNRGFDMSLGWHGNVEMQNQVRTTAPPVEKGMTK